MHPTPPRPAARAAVDPAQRPCTLPLWHWEHGCLLACARSLSSTRAFCFSPKLIYKYLSSLPRSLAFEGNWLAQSQVKDWLTVRAGTAARLALPTPLPREPPESEQREGDG